MLVGDGEIGDHTAPNVSKTDCLYTHPSVCIVMQVNGVSGLKALVALELLGSVMQ
jgi:hypothetical protein